MSRDVPIFGLKSYSVSIVGLVCHIKMQKRRMAIKTDENQAKSFHLALDSGSKLGCDVPSTDPPIHVCQLLD